MKTKIRESLCISSRVRTALVSRSSYQRVRNIVVLIDGAIEPSPQPSIISSTSAAGSSGRMPSSSYELLPQEGPSFGDTLYDERAHTHAGPVRPPTYYGEGPFDPPSSDDEDELLLRKENTRSLGLVERAGYAEPDAQVCPSLLSLG